MSFSGSTMGKHSRLWLIVTGVILLAVGGGLAVALSNVPFAGGAMLMTGGILGVVGLILIIVGIVVGQRAAAVDQILATGIAGTAQITGLTQTGMYLNEQPQVSMNLIVSLPGRTPYAATHKSFVPLILLGRLTSGAPLPVKVDQTDPQKIVIDWQNAGFGAPMAFPPASGVQLTGGPMGAQFPMSTPMGQPMGGQPMGTQPMGTQPMGQPALGTQPLDQSMAGMQPLSSTGAGSSVNESLSQVQAALSASGASVPQAYATPDQGQYNVEQLREWLRVNGLQGTARIDKATDTGKIVGDERLYTMALTLELPGRPPQQLPESAAMVPLTAMHKVQVGWKVPVRVAPDNPNLTMFEWDKV